MISKELDLVKVVIYVKRNYPKYRKATVYVTAEKRDIIISRLRSLLNSGKIIDYITITY